MKKLFKTMLGLFIVTAVFMLGCLSAPAVNEEPVQATGEAVQPTSEADEPVMEDSDGLAGTMWTWREGDEYIVLAFQASGEYEFLVNLKLGEYSPGGTYTVSGETVSLQPSEQYPVGLSHNQIFWSSAPVTFTIANDSFTIVEFTYTKGLRYY